MNRIGHNLVALVSLFAGLFNASMTRGDDDAASATPALTVRDTLILEASVYETTMNARARVSSTLPRSLAGRRPINDETSIVRPMPLGVVTFEGQPADDLDVLVEYNGRAMAHVPAASARARRFLWGRLDLTTSPTSSEPVIPPGHWLEMLTKTDRLWVQGPSTNSSRCLLYDVEHNAKPQATIVIEKGQWFAKNIGRTPILNVAAFRPDHTGQFWLGVIDEVEAYEPKKKSKADKSKPDDAKPAKPVADPAAVAVAANLINQVMQVPGQPKAKESSEDTKPPEVKAKPGVLAEWAFDEPADAAIAVEQYVSRLINLGDVERAYVKAVLTQRIESSTSTILVYQLDDEALERLSSIELTPQPDRLLRTGLVVVVDADPSLADEIEQLIKQLGDAVWAEREAAESRLRELGQITERSLKAALKNDDFEVRHRAQRLLDGFRLKAK